MYQVNLVTSADCKQNKQWRLIKKANNVYLFIVVTFMSLLWIIKSRVCDWATWSDNIVQPIVFNLFYFISCGLSIKDVRMKSRKIDPLFPCGHTINFEKSGGRPHILKKPLVSKMSALDKPSFLQLWTSFMNSP